MHSERPADTALVIRAQRGDEAAFGRLATDAASRYHRVAYGILRDRAAAEDATQQALLAIWRSLPQLQDPARYDAWAYRTVVRTCYRESKRHRRWLQAFTSLAGDRPRTTNPFGDVEIRDEIELALSRLSIEHRAVLVLRFHADLKIDDIAAILDIAPGTARSRLDRALKKLRVLLERTSTDVGAGVREEAGR